MLSYKKIGLIALTLAGAPALLAAQTSTLDEGAFRLMVGGREVGRETFSIRQSGMGDAAVIVAQGRVTLDRRQVTSTLETSGGLRPAAYEVEVEDDGRQRIAGRVVGGRFSAKITSPGGEMMREYLASEGAVLVDEGVAHHYFFLARAAANRPSVPIIVPQENRQVSVRVSVAGTEQVEVGGSSVEARRLLIEPAQGDTRHVWIDGRGRVLRLEIPAKQYVAVRAQLPG